MERFLADPRRLLQLGPLAAAVAALASAAPLFERSLSASPDRSLPAAADRAAPAASAAPAAPVPDLAQDRLLRPAALAPTLPEAKEKHPGYEVVRVRRGQAVSLRARPRGRVMARLDAITEFGSPQTLGVVKRRGQWLGVATSALQNGRLGWLRADDPAARLSSVRVSLTLDLSRRKLVLKRGDRVLRRMTVGIGRAESPTPTGRFAVTDKLPGSRYGSYYGCCIVALSAHQPRLPAGWRGGDRIAVHGTNQPSSIGVPSSAGCPHASEADMRVLMGRVPLGTPVFIRA